MASWLGEYNVMETALTLDDVAQFLKVSPHTVRRLAAKGELPGRKIGNKWRFSPLAIHLWLAGDEIPKWRMETKKTGNHYLDSYGVLASNPLTQEVEAFMGAEKERERQIAQSENL